MKRPGSLQIRLGLAVGGLIALVWGAGALITGRLVRAEMDEVFDSALQETAQRILPLAVTEILGREDLGAAPQTIPAIRAHEEYFTYVVRDAAGKVLVQSHTADARAFPPYDGPGLRTDRQMRYFSDEALQGSVTITVAEPLEHRREVAGEVQAGLLAPLAVLVPLALAGLALVLRLGFAPLRRFRDTLAGRSGADLSPVDSTGLPAEVAPLAETFNDLLARLDTAFQAERSFAANAAHELRTPLAGAIAQAQRLRAETTDPTARNRASDIETVLKRLTRLAEGLMSLARAEGGKLRRDHVQDLRPVARLVAEDAARLAGAPPVLIELPSSPVVSDLDPDLFGILLRNLVANALHHGTPGGPVRVILQASGRLRVENDCAALPPETLARLGARFERGTATVREGSGLGLAIVRAISARAGGTLSLASPLPGQNRGFAAEATFLLSRQAELAPNPEDKNDPNLRIRP